MSTIEPLFNLNMISSFTQYICCLVARSSPLWWLFQFLWCWDLQSQGVWVLMDIYVLTQFDPLSLKPFPILGPPLGGMSSAVRSPFRWQFLCHEGDQSHRAWRQGDQIYLLPSQGQRYVQKVIINFQYLYSWCAHVFGVGALIAHKWELIFSYYHKVMVIHPYPFLVVITQLFSWIIFNNDCIYIY